MSRDGKFSIGNTLLTFRDKYFEYGGGLAAEERGLTIGAYKSFWLADLVVLFILDNKKRAFKDAIYFGIYRDDGISVMQGNWSKCDTAIWLKTFNMAVKRTAGSDNLQFPVDTRGIDNEKDKKLKMSQFMKEKCFPSLTLKCLN